MMHFKEKLALQWALLAHCRTALALACVVFGCAANSLPTAAASLLHDACTVHASHCSLQLVHFGAAKQPAKQSMNQFTRPRRKNAPTFAATPSGAAWPPLSGLRRLWTSRSKRSNTWISHSSLGHQKSEPSENSAEITPNGQATSLDRTTQSLASTVSMDTSLSTVGVVALSSQECDAAMLTSWKNKSEKLKKVLTAWQDHRPNGYIQFDDGGEGCADGNSSMHTEQTMLIDQQGSNKPVTLPSRPLTPNTQMLNIIHQSPPDICMSEPENQHMDNFFNLPQHLFNISGKMMDLSSVRSYGIVWPARLICLESRCPVVMSLQGASEHANYARNYFDFQMMGNTGLMRAVQKDVECVRSLRSVIIFPQLIKGESWVKDGPELVELFIIPLLRQIVSRYDDMVDPNRVAIVGYSEGAFGVLQAATRHPHIFTFATAIAASLSASNWNNVRHMTPSDLAARPAERDWRLQALVVALGERDESGDQAANVRNTLSMVDAAKMNNQVPLMVRFYAGLGHNHWVHVYNRWPAFHEVVWKGNFDKMFRGATDDLLLRVPSKLMLGDRFAQRNSSTARSSREWWLPP